MNAANTITAHGLTGFLGRGAAQREMECLLAVAGGATGKEAARALGVTEDTIKKRLLSLTTKLGVTRRAALVAKAFSLGLIQVSGVIAPNPGPQDQRDIDQFQGIFIA
ncbi:helix-turn-helix domain-containing protein [Pseudomonas sp. HN8-3]|uniref:helix-turn-helix domain-containing protein n=1 Tax=Pseudomonas sp. HN8-3 TaxID=2886361 RepID=UPI001E2C5D02|nr:helix-turn-helix transcriptional regulator [Pseudomonas sp. HN8-3]UEH06698.1 helix-turn-helix transcriptional regulator [Pseudomonas sp. HN8-3]